MISIKSIFTASLSTLALVANAAPTIVNGSLTGAIANGGVPPGWTVLSESPDTMDQNNNAGVPGTNFVAAPANPSTDGGTWVGIGRDNGANFIESFGQSVAGFSIGATYELSWEHGNFGYTNAFVTAYDGANEIEVLVDGVSIGFGPTLSPDRLWHDESITFVATAANHQIAFRLASGARSYHSIDGIALSEVTNVPEPLSLALAGLGLCGLAVSRRGRFLR